MNNLDLLIKEKTSIWENIKNDSRPVVLYGMGDGAVKLLSILDSIGVKPVGIFASDEFVRYNQFCSYTVKKLSDIEAEFDDFIILVAFATHLDSVRERIFSLASRHTVFIPDINVTGDPLEIFDSQFYRNNYSRLEEVYENLFDERSKKAFAALINFKLSGKIEYLEELEALRLEETLPYNRESIFSFADFGAYTGDTLTEAFDTYPRLERAICFEPDTKTFKKLEKNVEQLNKNIKCINAVAWNENCELELFESSGRNTLIKINAFDDEEMQKKKVKKVTAHRADSVSDFTPDLIKMDVEGCEREALDGCLKFFDSEMPTLRISIYHNNRDIFEIYEQITRIKKGYKFSISQKCTYIPAWDIELVAFKP